MDISSNQTIFGMSSRNIKINNKKSKMSDNRDKWINNPEYHPQLSEQSDFLKKRRINEDYNSLNTNIPIKNSNKEFESKKSSKKMQVTEIKDEEEEKRIIIQTHSEFCDIEKIDDEFYLVNKKEIELSYQIYKSLIENSKNIEIAINTFNIAQVNLFKERFKNELSFVKIILLEENCSNFDYSDYIIISYIESEISEQSKKKYNNFKSNLNSKKFYTEEFTKKVSETYTRIRLYIICNHDYLKKTIENTINNEDSKEEENSIKQSINVNIEIPTAQKFKEIQVKKINRDNVSNEYNVCFIVDNTGSMGSWINVIKDICKNLFGEIVAKFSKFQFSFGCVFYADKISINTDQNYKINFTKDENEFRAKLEEIELQGGDDVAENWVSGFRIALDELEWGNGTKLIFHIADAPHHGKIFNIDKKDDNFLDEEDDINGKNLIKLIERCSERNIKITGINIDKVASFNVFKREYEKVNGPNYEIIDVNGEELVKGNDFINKKVLDIIEKSLDKNKADESQIIK